MENQAQPQSGTVPSQVVTAPQPPGLKALTMKVVMWSVRNHWLWMVVVIAIQWVSGSVLGGNLPFLARLFSFATWRTIHLLNSWLIVATVVVMTVEKLFLWLSRSGRI